MGAEVDVLVGKYDALHDKARRRHKEETARTTDEEACCTDTSRVRDLRTLCILGNAVINQTRQVNAKDVFSLDLQHSNGQRLTCQVELVFRDNTCVPNDRGDLLIRETGNRKNWLLFAPVSISDVSAGRGSLNDEIIVMIRGFYKGNEWHEFLCLTCNCNEQIQDWLEILGKDPVPPPLTRTQRLMIQQHSPSSPKTSDVPLGEQSLCHCSDPTSLYPSKPRFQEPTSPKTPSRYDGCQRSVHSSSTSPSAGGHASSSDLDAPAQEPYMQGPRSNEQSPNRPVSQGSETSAESDSTTVAPTVNKISQDHDLNYQQPRASTVVDEDDDVPPPPPAHKTFPSKQSAHLSRPVELPPKRLRRHGSSPLKHEYHPSDVSSEEESEEDYSDSENSDSSEEETETETETDTQTETASESESESDPSEDELDTEDASVIMPAISIKRLEPGPEEPHPGSHIQSQVGTALGTEMDSEVTGSSIAPEHSASQVKIPTYGDPNMEYLIKTIAKISYWSNRRAQWKDAVAEQCSIIVTPGLLEAYAIPPSVQTSRQTTDSDDDGNCPLIALDLTPLVMIRQSTVIDLEIRSPARSYSKLSNPDASIFRFRASSAPECATLYAAVHTGRMNNAKFKALEQEARFRTFGQQPREQPNGDDASTSTNRRSWFGRKNSYRAARAPSTIHSQSQSQSSSMSSGISASSFLRKLTGQGNSSFNIERSSVDKQGSPGGSMYTCSDRLRSPSISYAGSGRGTDGHLGMDKLRIRCHLLVSPTKWEDFGNCRLQIVRPPPGMKQELRAWHGLEKRIIVTSVPKKSILAVEGRGSGGGGDGGSSSMQANSPRVILDVVLGSGCFSRLGTRGICLNVWEEGRGEGSDVARAPETGMPGGKVTKWCFQCVNVAEANWIFRLVNQEVIIA